MSKQIQEKVQQSTGLLREIFPHFTSFATLQIKKKTYELSLSRNFQDVFLRLDISFILYISIFYYIINSCKKNEQ